MEFNWDDILRYALLWIWESKFAHLVRKEVHPTCDLKFSGIMMLWSYGAMEMVPEYTEGAESLFKGCAGTYVSRWGSE